ncbi:hypothetical protein BOX15_Mlig013841g3, partial [Macrostomum lignano]
LPAAMKPESSTATVVIRYGTPDDMYQVTCHEKELAKCHENMLQYCRLGSEAHRQMLMDGLFRIMVAEAEGRVIGYLLYTPSYLLRHAEPGFYVQSLYVEPLYRRHQVGQSLLATLGRLAASSGFGHLKLLVQHSNAPAVNCYRRLGFDFLTETENIGFFELWPPKFITSTLQAGRRPLPAGLHLELRDCGGRLSGKLETGRRFALTCAACDCRLQGTVALTYCMWDGPVAQADLEAVRPSCPARGCALLNAANLRRLFGRLLLTCLPVRPVRLWLEAGRRDSRLRQLLIKIGLEDSTASELWHVCDLSGPGLSELAGRSVACPSVGRLAIDAGALTAEL